MWKMKNSEYFLHTLYDLSLMAQTNTNSGHPILQTET